MDAPKKYLQGEERIHVPRFCEEAGFYATPQGSKTMRKIKAKNTKPELLLRKALWKEGCRYRLKKKGLVGKPDIIFAKHKLVVFVDGDFWHGYNWEQTKQRLNTNKNFWIPKIERNLQRYMEVNNWFEQKCWRVLRFWEHEVQKNLDACVAKVLWAIGADVR